MSTEPVLRYTYDKVRAYPFDKYEFGYPYYQFTWHLLPDKTVVASWCGHRIYEIRPDGSQYLVYNEKKHSHGVTNRWTEFFANVEFATKRTTKANGMKQFTVNFWQSEYVNNRFKRTNSGTATGTKLFQVTAPDNKLVLTPVETDGPMYTKDNAKYREFNKQLKGLRSVLVAQIKMGAYDAERALAKYDHNKDGTPSLSGELKKYLCIDRKNYVPYQQIDNYQIECALRWIETRDNSVLRPLVLCCLYNHRSDADSDTRENAIRRVKNGLLVVQKHYLRTKCVKISESINSLSLSNESDDQDSELLPPAGLREVQVPREAQVC